MPSEKVKILSDRELDGIAEDALRKEFKARYKTILWFRRVVRPALLANTLDKQLLRVAYFEFVKAAMAAKHLLRESHDQMFSYLESLAPTEDDIKDRVDLYRMAYLDCDKGRPFDDDVLTGAKEMATRLQWEILHLMENEDLFPKLKREFGERQAYADQLTLDI